MAITRTPTPFNATPNTAEPTVKTVAWLTALEVSKNGTERRTSLRAVPRLGYSASYYVGPSEWSALRTSDVLTLPAHPVLPAGNYELADPDSELEHVRYGKTAAVSLELLATANNEVVPPYAGPRSMQQPARFLFPAAVVNGREQPRDGVSWSVNEFDEGNVRSRQLRYRKRSVSLLATLNGAEQLAQFYSFLHEMRGRYGAFRYQHFVDDIERTWRLGSDSVSLKFYRPDFAECQLRLVHLENE